MHKFIESRRRTIFKNGRKMIILPYSRFIKFSLACNAISVALIAVFSQAWRYTDFSPIIFICNLLEYSTYVAISVLILALIFKIIVLIFGALMTLLGSPDKISLERLNNGSFIEIQINNDEDEKFVGELKILKINDEKLVNPLLMGIARGQNIDPQIIIPKNESVSIRIGFFDKKSNNAFFSDAYKQQIMLLPQTRIYTKLSGNLENKEEIIKEQDWFINYKVNNGDLDFSIVKLLIMENLIIKSGKIKLISNWSIIKHLTNKKK